LQRLLLPAAAAAAATFQRGMVRGLIKRQLTHVLYRSRVYLSLIKVQQLLVVCTGVHMHVRTCGVCAVSEHCTDSLLLLSRLCWTPTSFRTCVASDESMAFCAEPLSCGLCTSRASADFPRKLQPSMSASTSTLIQYMSELKGVSDMSEEFQGGCQVRVAQF
jgi:hypothetical protein